MRRKKAAVRNGLNNVVLPSVLVFLKVLDTCGMFDTKRPREEVEEEIRKSHLMIAPGPHAFLLIVPIEQYTAEHQESVRRLEDIFPNFYGHAIVVFTKADRLDGPLEEALAECDALKALCDRVSGRYIAFNNKEKNEARLDQQVYGLLDMVYDLYEANKQRHYKSDLFKQAERLASHHAEQIVNEAEHAHKSNTQKVNTAITLLRRLPRNTLRHTVDGAPADSIARMILNNDLNSGRARGVLSAMSFDVLAAAINPTTDLSTGSVYVKTKTGERVKDCAALQELK